MRVFLVLLLLSLAAAGCARRNYQSQALMPAALATHRTVAILPFVVEMERLKDGLLPTGPWPYNYSLYQSGGAQQKLNLARQQMGYQLQALFQAELMRQQVQHPTTATFQNPADTNQRLARAGITYESLPTRSMAELRAALGVDAVLRGETDLHQLLPGSVSVAMYLLSNDGSNPMADNTVRTYLDIYDAQTSQLVWHFAHELRGKPSISPLALTKNLVHSLKGGFPYSIP